jgi:septal ring factor EnvC (AmiA/AmiB activator)
VRQRGRSVGEGSALPGPSRQEAAASWTSLCLVPKPDGAARGTAYPPAGVKGRSPLATFLAIALLLAPAAAIAQSSRDLRDAERVAQERRRAAEAASGEVRQRAEEEVRLAGERVEAARRAQEAEEEVLGARATADLARQAGAAASAAVRARAEALSPLLPVMLRLSLWPAETVLAVPAAPEEALRGALVLRGMVRKLEEEAAALRLAQHDADAAAAVAERDAAALARAEAQARAAAERVEAELAEARRRRAAAEAAEDQAADRAQAAAAQARDLAEMVQRLERERVRREAEERANAAVRAAEEARRRAEEARERRLAEAARTRAAEEARAHASRPRAQRDDPPPQREASLPPVSGGRVLPVAGRITTGWGEAGAGGTQRGLTFAAAAGARVVSPCAGRAVYAAPFRSYGLLLIVDCGGGYHFVLAGLDRLDAAAGQRLLAGEPVGVLAASGGAGASLYVELRRNGQPVDPRPWFSARG